MNSLLVTTFNHKIWKASAMEMVNSYITSKSSFDFLICYEDDEKYYTNKISLDSFILEAIDDNDFLKAWMEENKDIIPVKMGGVATKKSCPGAFSWQNIRAAGWFRKIVSLNIALKNYGNNYDSIIFIDADCIFCKNITPEIITSAFGGNSVFYHLGKYRKLRGFGVETGIVGFLNDGIGYKVLEDWIHIYRNKKFLKYKEWDDGSLFRRLLEEREFLDCIDLVENLDPIPGRKTHVVEGGIFSEYIKHKKGYHRRINLGGAT